MLVTVLIREDGILFIRADSESLSVYHVRGIAGVEVGIVHTPARLRGTGVTYQRLGVVGVPQVPDDVPHVTELTVGRGHHGLHADQTAVRAGAVALTYSGQQVRSRSLYHVARPHLDTAGHGGGLEALEG